METKWQLYMMAFCCFLFGFCVHELIGSFEKRTLKTDIIGASVEQHKCYDTGCSFLVEHKDRTREWLWLPKLVIK